MISSRYYISDIQNTLIKESEKIIVKNANQKKLEALDKEAEKLRSEALDLIIEYLDVEELSLDEIKEKLDQIKKKCLDNWREASKLM